MFFQFWNSFFEEAAQTRISADDYSADIEQHSATVTQSEPTEEAVETNADAEVEIEQAGDYSLHPEQQSRDNAFDPNVTPSESSFMPAQGAISSTPMAGSMGRRHEDSSSLGLDSTHSSWAASMESPLQRIDRDLRSLQDGPSFAPETLIPSSTPIPPTLIPDTLTNTSRQVSPSATQESSYRPMMTEKAKGKQTQPTLLQNVLSKNLRTNNDTTSSQSHTSHTGPLKVKPKTPKRNPFVPPEVRLRDWDGVVDLSKPMTPRRNHSRNDFSSEEEEEDDRFLHGLSPPITMDFARPAKGSSAVAARIGRTPVKEAAARIGKDLVGDAERHRRLLFPGGPGLFGGLGQTSQSTQQSISSPSLSMYAKKALGMQSKSTSINTSLESLLRQVGPSAKGTFADKYRAPALNPVPNPVPNPQPIFDSKRQQTSDFDSFDAEDKCIGQQRYSPDRSLSDPDSDSFEDSPRSSGQPSTAFHMASQNQPADDSFDSNQSSSDSFDDADVDDTVAHAPIHPFARQAVEDDSFDDSFDDDSFDAGGAVRNDDGTEEPTVFGVRGSSGSGGSLRMHGGEVFDTGGGLTAHMQREEFIPETPTPVYGR